MTTRRFVFVLLLALIVVTPLFAQYRDYKWSKDVTVPYPEGDLTLHVYVSVFHLYSPDVHPVHVTVGGWIYTPDMNANLYRVTIEWRNGNGIPQPVKVEWIAPQLWATLSGPVHGLDRIAVILPPDALVDNVIVEKMHIDTLGTAQVSAN